MDQISPTKKVTLSYLQENSASVKNAKNHSQVHIKIIMAMCAHVFIYIYGFHTFQPSPLSNEI